MPAGRPSVTSCGTKRSWAPGSGADPCSFGIRTSSTCAPEPIEPVKASSSSRAKVSSWAPDRSRMTPRTSSTPTWASCVTASTTASSSSSPATRTIGAKWSVSQAAHDPKSMPISMVRDPGRKPAAWTARGRMSMTRVSEGSVCRAATVSSGTSVPRMSGTPRVLAGPMYS